MKRMFSGLQRRVASPLSASDSPSPTSPGNDTPESIIAREIKAFCESGSNGNGSSSAANDYIHLPAIVDAAESSANAAKEAVVRIRKYLSNPSKVSGSTQYNSIMLIRILSENPGHTFTRNFDTKFVTTVKELLREGRDMSAQQMLRETLDMFETQKSWDEGLAELIRMWKREKQRIGISTPPPMHPQYAQRAGPYAPSPRRNQLPPPDELASRISEARTSANLLIQLAQSTPATEVPSHELMREFCQRCEAAHRSIQGYMAVENPPPDENTMLTLIETNEQLSVALSKYQRTLLNARKTLGTSTPPPNTNGHQQPNTRDRSPAINGQANGQANGNSGGAKSGILIAELEAENSSSADANSSRTSPAQRNTFASLNGPFSFDTSFETSSLGNTTTTAAAAAKSGSDSSSKPTAASNAATPSKRYDYNPDEFNVENPFADNAGGDNLDHGFDRGNNENTDHQHNQSRREV